MTKYCIDWCRDALNSCQSLCRELFQWFMHKELTPDAEDGAKEILHFSLRFWIFIHLSDKSCIHWTHYLDHNTVINFVCVCVVLLLWIWAGIFRCCSFSRFYFCVFFLHIWFLCVGFISWSYLMCGIPVVNVNMQILFIGFAVMCCFLFAPIKN